MNRLFKGKLILFEPLYLSQWPLHFQSITLSSKGIENRC